MGNCEQPAESRELERQLEQAQKQIMHLENLDSIGQLAAGVAHEFNNIIGGMRGFAELAKETGDPEITKQALDVVLDLSDRAAVITSGLLSLSKKRPPQKTLIDINELIKNQIKICASQCAIRNIEVISQLNNLPKIRIDKSQIQQVISNLVNNAMQAMPDGGTLSLMSSIRDSNVSIEVRDSGPGIPTHICKRIFDPFFTTKGALGGGNVGGTGLGLSVANGIVNSHYGNIAVDTQVGQGASFVVVLPALIDERQIVTKSTKSKPGGMVPSGKAQHTILVVDDEHLIVQALSMYLTDKGHHVLTASNADDGIRLFKEHVPDLVFLDIIMPGMNGADAYLEMKRLNPDMVAAVITGHTGEHLDMLLNIMKELGEIEVFRKPFKISDIHDFVNRVFNTPVT